MKSHEAQWGRCNPQPPVATPLAESAVSLLRDIKSRNLRKNRVTLVGFLFQRGFRKHVLKSADSVLSLSSDLQASPRSSGRFNFKSPKKSPKNGNYDQSANYRGSKLLKGKLHDKVIATLPVDFVYCIGNLLFVK